VFSNNFVRSYFTGNLEEEEARKIADYLQKELLVRTDDFDATEGV